MNEKVDHAMENATKKPAQTKKQPTPLRFLLILMCTSPRDPKISLLVVEIIQKTR